MSFPTHRELQKIISGLPEDSLGRIIDGFLNFPKGTAKMKLHLWNDDLDTKYPRIFRRVIRR